MVSEYVNDIFEYLHQLEVITLPKKEDLYPHRNIHQNRDILVNWLVKIHNKFGLLPETLYLAINIMDRFLGKELVQLDKLQLVGTSCLFIASKYEEVYSPSIKHFASETDGACTEDEIKEGEKFILKTLKFNLNYPNPMNFLRRISKADDYDIQSRTLAKFLLEISLVDFRFIGILPSLCAAAAMFMSRKMLGKGKWDGNLIHYSGGYTKEELAPVCHMIMDYLVSPIVHDEFHRKYQSRRFMKASIISVQWALKVRKNGYDIMTLHE
ncbi:Clb2p [Saccharomyces cerevisiae FostersO]|nr:Clb2p [Saccharomyces cerevisiae FostersO]